MLRSDGLVARVAVERLLDKYKRMLGLRQRAGHTSRSQATRAMRHLSAMFPGSLVELDRMTVVQIQQRIAVLKHVLRGRESLPDWARWMVHFHGWLRALLRLRRHVNSTRLSPKRTTVVLTGYRADIDEPGKAQLNAEVLGAMCKPPGGRLSEWLQAYLATMLGVERDVFVTTLFPWKLIKRRES